MTTPEPERAGDDASPRQEADEGSEAARSMEEDRSTGGYGRLLLLVLVAIVVPLALPDGVFTLLAVAGLQGGTILVGLGVAHASRRTRRRAAFAVGVTGIAIAGGLGLSAGLGLEPVEQLDVARGIGIALAATLMGIIGVDIIRHPRITLQTVWGGLSVYLLVGLFFAYIHGLVSSLVDGAFTEALGFNQALYFSFITQTTVGFGDVTPVAEIAKAFAVTQAVTGQLYLVSVIALLVGNLGATRGVEGWRRHT